MKKNTLFIIIILFNTLMQNLAAQCEFPQQFNGNTGSNMTLLFDSSFINSLNIQSSEAYIAATTQSGLVVGSTSVNNTQFSMAVWGDDTFTPETDGAFEGELINLHLIDSNKLYNTNISFNYVTNGIDVISNEVLPSLICTLDTEIFGCTDQSAMNYNPDANVDNGTCEYEIFGCTDPLALNHNPDATVDDGSCDYNHSECVFPPEFVGNTGVNMTVFLTSSVISALPISSDYPYLVALSPSGLVVGSASLSSEDLVGGQQSLAVWGDDTSTPDIDGALAGEEIFFQLVDGTLLYDVDLSFAGPNSFVVNGTLPAIGASHNFICSQEIVGDIFGCMDPSAMNYNPDANVDNGTCEYEIFGCMDQSAMNYNPDANVDNGTCEYEIFGCMDQSAMNYNPDANVDNGTCEYEIFGCMDQSAMNYNPDANVDNGTCEYEIFGCTDPLALNHNPDATVDDGSCDYNHSECVFPPEFVGNTGVNMTVFLTSSVISALPISSDYPYLVALSPSGLVVGSASLSSEDLVGGQQSLAVWGDDTSTPDIDGALAGEEIFFQLVDGTLLYDVDLSFAGPNSFVVNGTLPAIGASHNFICSQEIVGDIFGCWMCCMNYNPDANVDNGTCEYEIFGCMDQSAMNYNPDANVDNGTCEYEIFGCTDQSAMNYNPDANVDNGTCEYEIFGCTDPLALNHNPDATVDDGSCDYNHSECVFPPEFVGNTGVNMTVFLTSGVVSALPLTSDYPYLVALSPSGLLSVVHL